MAQASSLLLSHTQYSESHPVSLITYPVAQTTNCFSLELPPTFVKEASVYLKPSDNKLTIKLANKTLCCTIGVYFLPDLAIRPSRTLVVTKASKSLCNSKIKSIVGSVTTDSTAFVKNIRGTGKKVDHYV